MTSMLTRCALFLLLILSATAHLSAAPLRAGAAKVDITRAIAPTRPGDRLWARALVVKSEETTLVMVTLDAVAIENIGYIQNDYLPTVRAALQKELQIQPQSVLVNASHCHGIVCADVDAADRAGGEGGVEEPGAGQSRRRARPRRPDHGEPPAQAQERQGGRRAPRLFAAARRRSRRRSGRSIRRSASCGWTGRTGRRWRSSTTSPAIRSRAFRAAATRPTSPASPRK